MSPLTSVHRVEVSRVFRSIIIGLFAVFFFFALFPILPDTYLSFFDRQRLLQIALLIIISVFAILGFVSRSFDFSRYDWVSIRLMGAFGFLGFISALLSEERLDSLMYAAHIVLLFVLLMFAATRYSVAICQKTILAFVIFHSSLVCYSLLFLVFSLSDDGPIRAAVIYFGFDNIRFYNQVQLFALPFLLYYTLDLRLGRLAGLLLSANLLLMFLGGGLGVAIIWPVLLIIVALINRKIAFGWMIATVIFFLSATWLLELKAMVEDGVSAVPISDGGRIAMWLGTIEQLSLSNILYGKGPGLFAVELGLLVFSHPHNSVLEILVEWGLPALIVVLVLIFVTIRRIFSFLKASTSYGFSQAVCISWLGGAAYSLVSGVIVMPVAQTLFFLTWGIVLAVIKQGNCSEERTEVNESEKQRKSFTNNRARLVMILVLSLITLTYAILVATSYYRLDIMEPAFQGPRFWVNGVRYL